MDWAAVPDRLWNLILLDGIGLTSQMDYDSLGEFDFTRGSGWMYSINGSNYAGKGLSNYYLSNGDTLYLRFTLAFGKDIGGASATGGLAGTLSSYCGIWINGTDTPLHQWGEAAVITEPTCSADGVQAATCMICGEHTDEVAIPALGHDYVETERVEAGPGVDGYVIYQCTRCMESYVETIPAENPPAPPEEPDPGDLPDPEPDPEVEPDPESGGE